MACDLGPEACRREHIAPRLAGAEADGGDWEARCPLCGHGGFRISRPTRSKYRHIWTCACPRHKCKAGDLRIALLERDVSPGCLGLYDGPGQKDIHPDTARRMDLTIRDILAVPGLKPADIRIILAEAQGRKVPEEFRPFVKFAIKLGIGRTQAQEAAARWCRPPDCPPVPGGGVDDTSRNTQPGSVVKPSSSGAQDVPVSGNRTAGNRHSDKSDTRRSGEVSAPNVLLPETG